MGDLYRISFVTDPDGRVLLADIDLVEPDGWMDVHENGTKAINFDAEPGMYAIVRMEDDDE